MNVNGDSVVSESPSPTRPPKSRFRLAVAGLAGTTIEYYDFFLYGTAAALVFGKAFFPSSDPFVSTLFAFSTLTVGFFARPIGAAVFGHFGDRLGRKRTLVVSLILVGASTFLIALLPTYGLAGPAAPTALITLRLIQGFALGGEWGGATLLLSENVDSRRRGFWASFPQVGPALGNLLAAGVLALLSAVLADQQFLAWGWRIPFALSAILLGVGLWVRLKVGETDEFLEQKAQREAAGAKPARIPFVTLITKFPKPLLIGVGLRLGESAGYYITTVYILQYATDVGGFERGTILSAVLIAVAAESVLVPFFGALTDKIGRRPVYAIAAVAVIPYVFLLFGVVGTGSAGLVTLVVLLGGIIHAAFAGTHGAYFSELFDTEVRYSGVSLGFNIGAVLGGGLTPIIGLALYQASGSSAAFSLYVSGLAVLTLLATLAAGETLPALAGRRRKSERSLALDRSEES